MREKALTAVQAIAQHSEISAHVEPYLITLLPVVLAAAGDKITAVKNAAFATAPGPSPRPSTPMPSRPPSRP